MDEVEPSPPLGDCVFIDEKEFDRVIVLEPGQTLYHRSHKHPPTVPSTAASQSPSDEMVSTF